MTDRTIYPGIEVSARVTLSGEVRTRSQKNEAAEIAAGRVGVEDVDNRLAVNSAA